ncbi:glycosyltransferase [Microbacterium wangruii]|uniref:glycosyltransferase n=1 Tax=Microbacterium wangruii TaxID=3049073 RepID=UPI00256F5223|nr:glycosyltransferase [Microbacterium sp. zg-Y1211]MDL5486598.1 glycosyltransferase [Microbacterium sp. zg-Y1211]
MNGPFDAAVSALRELRRLPGLRRAFESTDDLRRIRRLAASGLIDTNLYAAQLGLDTVSLDEAAAHYVRWGHAAGLTINPLLDHGTLRGLFPGSNRPAAYDYIWQRLWDAPVSPLWDVRRYMQDNPGAREHRLGPVGHAWDSVRAAPRTALPTHVGDAIAWEDLVEVNRNALGAWGEGDALRRARRVHPHFHGVESLGRWDESAARPLISVVLATWNRSGELRRAVESVLDQSWPNWELLIVDDGSWDDTPTIAGLLAERDPRIHYLPREHRGVSAARNSGIAEASGRYITFLDSDNAWQPSFLENMMIAMEREGDAVAYATIELDNGRRAMFREAAASPENLALGNVVDLNTLIVRRDALTEVGGFDETLLRAVDYDLILRLSARFPFTHVPVLGAIYENRAEGRDRISTSQPLGWNTFVRLKNAVDWNTATSRSLSAGATVLVLAHREDPWLTDRLSAAAELANSSENTVVFAMIDPTPSDWLRVVEATRREPGLNPWLLPNTEPFAYAVNRVLAEAQREIFVVTDPASRFESDSVRRLIAAVNDRERTLAFPLQLHPDATIVSVGAGFPQHGAAPVELLSRHPREDARMLGAEFVAPAASGRTFAASTRDLQSLQGLNPLLYNEYETTELTLRLRERFGAYDSVVLTEVEHRRIDLPHDFDRADPLGSLAVIREATASTSPTDFDALLRPLGLTVDHFRSVSPRDAGGEWVDTPAGTFHAARAPRHLHPVVTRSRQYIDIDGVPTPRLRWALRIASPAWPTGGTWGDTHFAESLASALRSLGQEVVIDHHEVDQRPTAYLDDVTLVLRGLDRVEPSTGGVSMLWVISHPDQVTRAEATRYDRVLAASTLWADRARTLWGLPVEPLLQCTDPMLFHPHTPPLERSDDIVFVGKSRGVARPSVVYPVRAGIPVRVFGSEWDGILPPDSVEAAYVPNDELGNLYGSAAVVLNDHWNDMRRDGFISNRLFDVVASGGRVISDEVEGIEEIFGTAVATFSSPQELIDMLTGPLDSLFPSEAELLDISERVRREHSFLARARQLLDIAIEELPPYRRAPQSAL